MFCKECGAGVRDTAVICVGCGSPLTTAAPPAVVSSGLLWSGWFCALFIPLLGVICGSVIIYRKRFEAGIAMVVVSLIMWMFWGAILSQYWSLTGQSY